jgi:hypothetical protein
MTDATDSTDLFDFPGCFFSENHLVETDYLIVIIMKTHKGGDYRELSVYTIILLFYIENYSRRGNFKFDMKSDGLNFMRYRSGCADNPQGSLIQSMKNDSSHVICSDTASERILLC